MKKKNLRQTDLALPAAIQKHLPKWLALAKTAALKAGAHAHKNFLKVKQIEEKSDSSLVTQVDSACEKIILSELKKKLPDHLFNAEESGKHHALETSPFQWHIDPIDGTHNYIHRFPMFCVSIGLAFYETPILGVIYQPMTKDLYWGAKNLGAFNNKTRLRVSKVDRLSRAMLSTGFNTKKDRYFNAELKSFRGIASVAHSIRRTGSAALDLTFVAAGLFDGFWERGLKPWDITAALVLLSEAGGKFTQLDGNPFLLGDEALLVSNGLLHEELLRSLKN